MAAATFSSLTNMSPFRCAGSTEPSTCRQVCVNAQRNRETTATGQCECASPEDLKKDAPEDQGRPGSKQAAEQLWIGAHGVGRRKGGGDGGRRSPRSEERRGGKECRS